MPSSVGPILFQCNPRRGSRTHSHQMHHSSPFLGDLQFQWIQSCQRVFLSAFSDGLKWEKGSYDCSSPCPTGCVLLSRFDVWNSETKTRPDSFYLGTYVYRECPTVWRRLNDNAQRRFWTIWMPILFCKSDCPHNLLPLDLTRLTGHDTAKVFVSLSSLYCTSVSPFCVSNRGLIPG